ncbi:hypothetical protein [Clostridium sp. AWRP]|nr:hypothetical protein [Clostridium sp. AWRP]
MSTELYSNNIPVTIKSSKFTYLDLKHDFCLETADIYYKNKDRLLKKLTT